MAKAADRFFDFIFGLKAVIVVYLLHGAVRAAVAWLHPSDELSLQGALMALGAYAVLAIIVWRRRDGWACGLLGFFVLFSALSMLWLSIRLSLNDPFGRLAENAYSLIMGAYLVLGSLTIFRSRRPKVVGIEPLAGQKQEPKDKT